MKVYCKLAVVKNTAYFNSLFNLIVSESTPIVINFIIARIAAHLSPGDPSCTPTHHQLPIITFYFFFSLLIYVIMSVSPISVFNFVISYQYDT